MLRKTTIVLFILFVLAVLFTYAMETSPTNIERRITPSTTLSPQLVKFSSQEIVRIDINNGLGENVTLEKDKNKQWAIKSDEQTSIDQGKVENLLTSIQSLTALSSLNPISDIEAFGLGKSAKVLTLYNDTNQKTSLKFGSKTPIESGYYLVIDDNTPIVVSTFGAEDIFGLMAKDSLKVSTPTSSPTLGAATDGTASVSPLATLQSTLEPGITATSKISGQPTIAQTAESATELVETKQVTATVK